MAALPEPISALIAALSKLPGIGPRSAERIALHLIQSEAGWVGNLADAMVSARERVGSCTVCGGLTEVQPCRICGDDRRDSSLVCLVERPVDIITIEKSATYRGKYHALGGKISPLNGIGPEDLRVVELEARLTNEPIREIIIALPSDVEGDATSSYLAKVLSERGVKVTRIAHGLPVGSGLEFADELTLSRAIEGRRELR
ncbi:MAG: recombination mediator RecR [Verrucomicrobia bacterium]|nr:recombination mediator RecR [Verrucomicrobiota bacterium]